MMDQQTMSLDRFVPSVPRKGQHYVSLAKSNSSPSPSRKGWSAGVSSPDYSERQKSMMENPPCPTHKHTYSSASDRFSSPAASPVINHHYEKIFNEQIVTDKETQLKKAMLASKTALNKIKRFSWMSWCIIVLFGSLSVVSLATRNLYVTGIDNHEIPELYTQDAVNVLVLLPLLSASHYLTMQGNVRGFVFWMSGMSLTFYNYLIYAFETNFNTLFLGYIVLITLSSFVIFGIVGILDSRALKKHFHPKMPRIAFSLFLVIFALCKLISWISIYLEILEVKQQPTQKSAFILDLSFVVPAYFLVAIMGWRNQSWGLVLTGVFLVDCVVMSCCTVFKSLTSIFYHEILGFQVMMRLYMFVAMFLLGLVMLGIYVTNLEPSLIKSAHFNLLPPPTSAFLGASEANSSDESLSVDTEGDISAYVSLNQVYQNVPENGSGMYDLAAGGFYPQSPVSLIRTANSILPLPKRVKQKERYRMQSSQSHENFYSAI
eukprot:CAMPEP_0117737962 /NCGR_PEP_ID=MMETSP0947-20121206/2840_1 /TAXON_ID=44440 /ORGANISM="Chattonella subsalsa, Strain CCMP2191" /LENGTH=488 /DNA_ID=CAMNT_0005553549 /DNA_START=54 /DNA_END=1520 /DNA_ORIENTATION=-